MRQTKIFELNDPHFRQRLLLWAGRQDVSCILNSNQDKQLFKDPYSNLDFMVGVGAADQILNPKSKSLNSFDLIKDFYESKKDWLFGFLTYDLKNDAGRPGENLKSENHDGLGFPAIHFFQPRLIFRSTAEISKMEVLFLDRFDTMSTVLQAMDEIASIEIPAKEEKAINIQPRVSKEEYISTVNLIKEHIQRGDIYEMNYCIEFFSVGSSISPSHIYKRLNDLSPMPFSCFYRIDGHYLMCASPERFIAKRGTRIISQPMKGTAKRGENQQEDELISHKLQNDLKEQSENVMIVDVVRNDLSHTAKKGSVLVKELFGVYAFEQLHQMVSTVVSEIKEDVHLTDAIKYLFPMASMTGAPKVRAMQLIEQFEKTKRGLYSGSVGYISPEGDFDFNVVIRSILYHEKKNYLSFMVGSAITANANTEQEYEECLLKAKSIFSLFIPKKRLTMSY